ncbi:hypothetical protein [Neisseria iguanae]|uniref:Uncharacterized protein n=1 Tax=Neisseria iguanae TaxID=90242 RepID=A0A2P7U0E7_9NEIS|nr:hypothetical protein [Neisseria iguanae]PSJ80437.1 hypothetical protein C7N83_06210 [Neisseria iguanae]
MGTKPFKSSELKLFKVGQTGFVRLLLLERQEIHFEKRKIRIGRMLKKTKWLIGNLINHFGWCVYILQRSQLAYFLHTFPTLPVFEASFLSEHNRNLSVYKMIS